ncbi:hypothetical protein [Mesorhizobium sp. CN2-181]|uniref:hypothetical protein n=1 Tax=Mesorhizobium yinganensis TaxID=3157707 RepID=UPI0032B79D43
MTVRAMFYVTEINHRATSSPGDVNVQVKMAAAFGSYLKGLAEGNKDWSKYTPSGELSITITAPGAIDQFEVGEVYEMTFEKAAKAD